MARPLSIHKISEALLLGGAVHDLGQPAICEPRRNDGNLSSSSGASPRWHQHDRSSRSGSIGELLGHESPAALKCVSTSKMCMPPPLSGAAVLGEQPAMILLGSPGSEARMFSIMNT